ncbi:hypoxanthine-guanine phosphoribosyltransferase-like [Artemia franciscana]|uniref:Hypoxanthine phosphoribosyltransferase n=1 Tax=Artemia franciscana TaxID=6661 RepID=A0AA88IDZ3_ARTSF|nr:hypothetical protein QYM36_008103 [Artemia franciscana]KAK2727493.1 hypothetical protein QYM36_008103 [Artemia franciscana]KAK2727494.1 hypothetical protein QYM36_008103 [Artemia franciscana]KAK2727495.1 hypothetical protein QYM36_008103 [Artemia franciscana]
MSTANFIKISDDFEGYDTASLSVPYHYENDLDKVIIPYGLIQDRIEKIAKDIVLDSFGEPITAVCILKGGYKFCSDLLDKINVVNRLQAKGSAPVKLEFVRIKSYVNEKSSGTVEIIDGASLDVKDKNVLVIEDIIDTGRTMKKLLNTLTSYNPKQVRVASLLLKRGTSLTGYKPDYCGFEIPDKFVVGYALDYNEYFRDLNHICVINENGIKKYSV